MQKWIRLATLLLSCHLLSACSSVKTQEEPEDPLLKVKTAKINTQLGIAYLEQKNIQRAKQKLLMAMEQAPKEPEPWYAMGYFMEATGNSNEARTYYQHAISLAPQRGDTHNNYGTYLCRKGEYRAAIDQFLLAVQDQSYLDVADAYENAGSCALRIPDYRSATNYFQRAVLQDPTRTFALYGLAEAYYKTGHYNQAQEKLAAYELMAGNNAQAKRLQNLLDKKVHPHLATTSPAVTQKFALESLPIKPVLASNKNTQDDDVSTQAVTVKVQPINTPVELAPLPRKHVNQTHKQTTKAKPPAALVSASHKKNASKHSIKHQTSAKQVSKPRLAPKAHAQTKKKTYTHQTKKHKQVALRKNKTLLKKEMILSAISNPNPPTSHPYYPQKESKIVVI